MNSAKYKDSIKLLMGVPGIGRTIAILWLPEIGDVRGFENTDRLNVCIGICPDTNSSGETQHDRRHNHWQTNFKKDEYFNQKWNAINGIQHTWDTKDKTWKKNQKWEYIYNTSGKITEEKYYFWDAKTSVYSLTGNNSYVYDKAGNVSAEIRTNYSWTSKEMTSKSKHECIYDGLNNMIRSNYYDWNLSKNVWEISSESNSKYDPSIPGNLIKMPFHSNYKLLSSNSVSYRNGVKKSASEYRYYYSNF